MTGIGDGVTGAIPEKQWREHAARMVAALDGRGAVLDAQWSWLLSTIPRHLFVPGAPLEEAYSDAVVIQTRRAPDGTGRDLATSSLSAPVAVAVAVEALALDGGERVLEIGTGTGYVAALLAGRLGSEQVYTMDIDPDLVTAATARLAALDLHPTIRTGDGYHALREHAPYDRILATCSISHVPPEWVRQLAPGGRIVAPLDGDLDSPVVVLDKVADDEVVGRLLLDGGGFMPLRATAESPLGPGDSHDPMQPQAVPSHGTTALDPDRLAARIPALMLFCHVHLPGLQVITRVGTPDGPTSLIVRQHESSAIVDRTPAENGRWPVIQSGPRRVWDTVETAVALWDQLDEPAPSRFGVSALDRPHRQYVWLDHPDGPHCWPLDQPLSWAAHDGRDH